MATFKSPNFGTQEVPFTLGSVRGLRAWRLYGDDGHLKAVSHCYQWENGLNTATCLATQHDKNCDSRQPLAPPPVTSAAPPWFILTRPCNCNATTGCDDLVGLDCGCGFWAYYKNTTLTYGGNVLGVIEGYGRTVEGTLGFRCQKARIRALFLPTFDECGVNEDDYRALWGWDPYSYAGYAESDTWQRMRDLRTQTGLNGITPVREETREQVRAAYPDAQIFNDYQAMVTAWPANNPPAEDQS